MARLFLCDNHDNIIVITFQSVSRPVRCYGMPCYLVSHLCSHRESTPHARSQVLDLRNEHSLGFAKASLGAILVHDCARACVALGSCRVRLDL